MKIHILVSGLLFMSLACAASPSDCQIQLSRRLDTATGFWIDANNHLGLYRDKENGDISIYWNASISVPKIQAFLHHLYALAPKAEVQFRTYTGRNRYSPSATWIARTPFYIYWPAFFKSQFRRPGEFVTRVHYTLRSDTPGLDKVEAFGGITSRDPSRDPEDREFTVKFRSAAFYIPEFRAALQELLSQTLMPRADRDRSAELVEILASEIPVN